jgi:hypothetical protein
VNPPGKLALDKVINLSAEAAAIEGMLRQKLWSRAADQAERRWYRLLDNADPVGAQEAERGALGMTMALRALARAGLDPQEQAWARCRWEAAQSLMPRLYELELSPYGAAPARPWRPGVRRPSAPRFNRTGRGAWRAGGRDTR